MTVVINAVVYYFVCKLLRVCHVTLACDFALTYTALKVYLFMMYGVSLSHQYFCICVKIKISNLKSYFAQVDSTLKASHQLALTRLQKDRKVIKRQWLFHHQRQFALGIYFAIIIHVCLYSHICYNYTSDTVV